MRRTVVNPADIFGGLSGIFVAVIQRRAGAPAIADRFELFAAGRELVNGFSEQNDPDVQSRRFCRTSKLKAAGDDEAMHYDSDYVRALEYGLPPKRRWRYRR